MHHTAGGQLQFLRPHIPQRHTLQMGKGSYQQSRQCQRLMAVVHDWEAARPVNLKLLAPESAQAKRLQEDRLWQHGNCNVEVSTAEDQMFQMLEVVHKRRGVHAGCQHSELLCTCEHFICPAPLGRVSSTWLRMGVNIGGQ